MHRGETWLGEEQAAWPVSPSTASHLLLWTLPGARTSGEEGLGDFSLGSERIVPSCWLSSQLVSFPTQPSKLPLQSCFWWFFFFFFFKGTRKTCYTEKSIQTHLPILWIGKVCQLLRFSPSWEPSVAGVLFLCVEWIWESAGGRGDQESG